MGNLRTLGIERRRVFVPGSAMLLALSQIASTPYLCAAFVDVGIEQESNSAKPAPPVARIWAERHDGSQANTEFVEKVLDDLRGAISRALASDRGKVGLTDQNGKTWTLAELKGKTTLMNLWFTSCGPCRSEMPFLEKLQMHVKDRSDMQVVTINVDRDADVARRFFNDNHYRFPVLFAWSVALAADGTVAPANWILDDGGITRVEDIGFASDGDQWVKRTLAQMESVRSSGR
jgi:thiol-disulfide isomerase/thioredoxin